jgi:hypothetical protein
MDFYVSMGWTIDERAQRHGPSLQTFAGVLWMVRKGQQEPYPSVQANECILWRPHLFQMTLNRRRRAPRFPGAKFEVARQTLLDKAGFRHQFLKAVNRVVAARTLCENKPEEIERGIDPGHRTVRPAVRKDSVFSDRPSQPVVSRF